MSSCGFDTGGAFQGENTWSAIARQALIDRPKLDTRMRQYPGGYHIRRSAGVGLCCTMACSQLRSLLDCGSASQTWLHKSPDAPRCCTPLTAAPDILSRCRTRESIAARQHRQVRADLRWLRPLFSSRYPRRARCVRPTNRRAARPLLADPAQRCPTARRLLTHGPALARC
jgi:hypothetical protein